MKYEAVIFDLFGTLVPNMSLSEHRAVLTRMAHVLSAPPDDFAQLWFDTFNERVTGILQSPEANIEYICKKLEVHVEDTQIRIAAQIRFDLTLRLMKPRADAIETLSHLKSQGYKTGLITDCSIEAPTIWESTPFASLIDVTVFSCVVGLKKPDPRIYQLAAERLGVEPHSCLYIGDGSSRELTGAAAAGMHPVLIRDSDEDSTEVHRVDAEAEKWDGPVISSLKDVLTLIR